MLEIGYNHGFEIRNEVYFTAVKSEISVMYLSDLHFNKFSNKVVTDLIETINKINPTIILLGGDFTDSKKGLVQFENLLNGITNRKHIYAIAGNHDYFFGINKIKEICLQNNINWIEKTQVVIELTSLKILIDGNIVTENNLVYDLAILCLHKPIETKNLKRSYHLIFAGHLHGSQFVFWKKNESLFPGKWFYKWNILKQTNLNSLYLISKGLGDTLPIRYNCKKDILLVTIKNKNL